MDVSSYSASYIRASDAVAWASCIRRAWLDHASQREPDTPIDEFEQLVIDMGLEHERAILEALQSSKEVVVASSVEHTHALMAAKTPVIYQAQLRDEQEQLIGFPDFLILSDNGNYQAADAKLSLKDTKKEIQVQLGLYRRLLNNGEDAIVYLGDGSQATISNEADKPLNQFLTQMRAALAEQEEPVVRYSHSKCKACPYYTHCKPTFEAKDDTSLIYGIQGRSADGLQAEGIETITQLANSKAEEIPDVPYLKGDEKRQRAVLQAKAHQTGEVFQLHAVDLPEGQWVHFDIEDNPLTASGEKHVYLWGFLVPDYSNENFEYVWTDNEEQDKSGWLQFLSLIEDYRVSYPQLILAHYSNHEVTTIKKYAERYDMLDDDTVQYLLGDNSPLYDIQKPVTANLVLPLQGYGLKDICKHKGLVNFQWEDDSSGSQWSIVQFNNFLNETNPDKREQLKTDILGYNRDDVIATRRLEEWLRDNF